MMKVSRPARCALLVLALLIPLELVLFAQSRPPSSPPPLQDRFDIEGIVLDSPDILAYMDKLEAAARQYNEAASLQYNEEMFRQALNRPAPPPAPGIVVTLRGEGLTREAKTDSKGKFRFTAIPFGEYEVWAEAPLRPTSLDGKTRSAIAKEKISFTQSYPSNERFPRNVKNVELRLRTDLVSIQGRVTDAQGNPIAGARVTATQDASNLFVGAEARCSDNYYRTWSTVSNADGSYRIQGIEPTGGGVEGYLQNQDGKPRADTVDIHVEAEGYIQSKEHTPRVPTVSEDQVALGRRFLKVINNFSRKVGKPEIQGKPDAIYPLSEGNVIKGIDIALEKDSKAGSSGEEFRGQDTELG